MIHCVKYGRRWIKRALSGIRYVPGYPSNWASKVRRGVVAYDATNCVLVFGQYERAVWGEGGKLFIFEKEKRVFLTVATVSKLSEIEIFKASDVDMKVRRKSKKETERLPDPMDGRLVDEVHTWPLGERGKIRAKEERYTDCIVVMNKSVRLSSRFNSLRVRYDGRYYVVYKGKQIEIVGQLRLDVFEKCFHVYGVDSEEDKKRNKELKGY